MPNPLITPNWHAILIHYPLAPLSLGIIIEILSFLWRRSSVRTAARWMIFLGTLACVPAITSGIYAYRDALSQKPQQTWDQLKHDNDFKHPVEQFAYMRDHILWNAIGTGVLIIVVVTYMGCSDKWRRKLYLPLFVVLLFGFSLLTSAAWHGGEAVYRYGTAVGGQHEIGNPQVDQNELANISALDATARRYVSVMQLHVFLMGVVIALTVAALGLSLRAMTWDATETRDEDWFENRTTSEDSSQSSVGAAGGEAAVDTVKTVTPEGSAGDAPSPGPGATAPPAEPPVPAPRWWMLAFLAALLTALVGLWCAHWYSWSEIEEHLMHPADYLKRNGAHLILGIGIVVLLLVLALVARVAKRSRLALWIFTILLALSIAAQIWVGVLLMFDTGDGSLRSFNDAAQPAAPTRPPTAATPGHDAHPAAPTPAVTTPAAKPAPAVNTGPTVPLVSAPASAPPMPPSVPPLPAVTPPATTAMPVAPAAPPAPVRPEVVAPAPAAVPAPAVVPEAPKVVVPPVPPMPPAPPMPPLPSATGPATAP